MPIPLNIFPAPITPQSNRPTDNRYLGSNITVVPPELITSDLQGPYGVAFDTDDRLFVSEVKTGAIRRIGDAMAMEL